MTSREKVLAVERQINEIMMGQRDVLECPFCGLNSTPDNVLLCCEPAADVTNAVLGHKDFKLQMEVMDNLMERVDKMKQGAFN